MTNSTLPQQRTHMEFFFPVVIFRAVQTAVSGIGLWSLAGKMAGPLKNHFFAVQNITPQIKVLEHWEFTVHIHSFYFHEGIKLALRITCKSETGFLSSVCTAPTTEGLSKHTSDLKAHILSYLLSKGFWLQHCLSINKFCPLPLCDLLLHQ